MTVAPPPISRSTRHLANALDLGPKTSRCSIVERLALIRICELVSAITTHAGFVQDFLSAVRATLCRARKRFGSTFSRRTPLIRDREIAGVRLQGRQHAPHSEVAELKLHQPTKLGSRVCSRLRPGFAPPMRSVRSLHARYLRDRHGRRRRPILGRLRRDCRRTILRRHLPQPIHDCSSMVNVLVSATRARLVGSIQLLAVWAGIKHHGREANVSPALAEEKDLARNPSLADLLQAPRHLADALDLSLPDHCAV